MSRTRGMSEKHGMTGGDSVRNAVTGWVRVREGGGMGCKSGRGNARVGKKPRQIVPILKF